jgi:hypothetical protein
VHVFVDVRTNRAVTTITAKGSQPLATSALVDREFGSVVDLVDVRLVRLDLFAVFLESHGEAVTDEVLVGDGAELALEITFGDDHPVANFEVSHAQSLARTRLAVASA